MQIDVTEKIDGAIVTTREWAEEAGYRSPDSSAPESMSERARNVARVLSVSSFGCQDRNVKALLEAVLGEKLPDHRRHHFYCYENPSAGFKQGTILVPADPRQEGGEGRPGMMMRVSKNGNVGLRYSNGEYASQYHGLPAVRPATEQEIRDYFAEFYGLQVSPFDTIEEPDETSEEPDFEDPFANATTGLRAVRWVGSTTA